MVFDKECMEEKKEPKEALSKSKEKSADKSELNTGESREAYEGTI
jgi:hypothetical protein